jgi:hypothetical protein
MSKKENEEIIDKTLENLINAFNKSNVKRKDIPMVLSSFLYSIGSSLSDKKYNTGEEILTDFALKPSLANALMTQAIHMKETWIVEEEPKTKTERTKKDGRKKTTNNRRKARTRKSSTSI